jgi:hypothetical protein
MKNISITSLHQLSPYIGRISPIMAKKLIETYSKPNCTVYDPFAGSGTLSLEAWIAGCNVIANDLNPYANILCKAKLNPYLSLDLALSSFEKCSRLTNNQLCNIDIRYVPKWVRNFYNSETLREIIAWISVLQRNNEYFLLSCLLGILHHQRPGFLSYPSSHSVPYLRDSLYPKNQFPQLYQYRNVAERLQRKVIRSFRQLPALDRTLLRKCHRRNAARFIPRDRAELIITSPPYMRQLDYARDNRLRLWFLGCEDWRMLDNRISPSEKVFIQIIKQCLQSWHKTLKPKGKCILILGDCIVKSRNLHLPDFVIELATKDIGGYQLIKKEFDYIPSERRVRRGYSGTSVETIVVLSKI